jgi:heme O synthase-like polyprenyltransferase
MDLQVERTTAIGIALLAVGVVAIAIAFPVFGFAGVFVVAAGMIVSIAGLLLAVNHYVSKLDGRTARFASGFASGGMPTLTLLLVLDLGIGFTVPLSVLGGASLLVGLAGGLYYR